MRTLFDKIIWNDFGRPKDGPEGAKTRDGFRNPSQQLAGIVNNAHKGVFYWLVDRAKSTRFSHRPSRLALWGRAVRQILALYRNLVRHVFGVVPDTPDEG